MLMRFSVTPGKWVMWAMLTSRVNVLDFCHKITKASFFYLQIVEEQNSQISIDTLDLT